LRLIIPSSRCGGPASAEPVLLDRQTERETIDGLLRAARDGLSGALVLRGELAVGKTSLLEYAAGDADRAGQRAARRRPAGLGLGISRMRAASVSVLCGRWIAKVENSLRNPWSRATASAGSGALPGALRA